jgi:hypothetical protein
MYDGFHSLIKAVKESVIIMEMAITGIMQMAMQILPRLPSRE